MRPSIKFICVNSCNAHIDKKIENGKIIGYCRKCNQIAEEA